MRQASIRNQRTKGFRVKHFLQLCLLAAIGIWLLYQLKHSYDKKLAIEERNRVTKSQSDFFKPGRKDFPHGEGRGSTNKAHNKEDENEEVEEEEEQETKQETENVQGSGAGDDEINETDEQDQERADEEAEHGEESADREDKDAQVEGTDLLDDKEDEGGSKETREEHYKKDDASSAVLHHTQMMETEFRNKGARSLDEEQMENEKYVERENVDNDMVDGLKGNIDTDTSVGAVDSSNGNVSSVAQGENGTMPDGNLSMNWTSVENRKPEVGVSKLEAQSVSNSTSVEYGSQRELQTNSTASTESNNQMELRTNTTAVLTNQMETHNNSTEVDAVTSSVPLQNETVKLDSVQDRNATVDTGAPEEDTPNMAAVVINLTEKSNTSENGDAAQGESGDPSRTEKSNTSNNRDAAQVESDDPSQTEKSNTSESGDAAQGEFDDSSQNTVTAEEREARTDLSTLPNLEIEAMNGEDEAAE